MAEGGGVVGWWCGGVVSPSQKNLNSDQFGVPGSLLEKLEDEPIIYSGLAPSQVVVWDF